MVDFFKCWLIFFLFVKICVLGEELKLVNILYRHGARTPISFYPNDPFKDRGNWPVGPGELTNEGKDYHFHLGQYLRKRYVNFLNETYLPEEFYCRSSNVDRTIMSAQSNLAGLFPPQGNQIWNKNLLWQPIPIHSVPDKSDEVLQMSSPCKAIENESSWLKKNSPLITKMNEENHDLLAEISKDTGLTLKSVLDLPYLYDTLFIENFYNKTLPDWTKKYYPDKMKYFFDFSFGFSTYSPLLKRLRGGPLLKLMIENMQSAINKNTTAKKMYMYSAHDTTVASFLNTLGVFNKLAPPFGATVIVELILSSGDFYVKLSYKNSTSEIHELTIPGCNTSCPFQTFIELTKEHIPGDWSAECGNSSYSIFVSIIVILIILFLVMSAVSFWLYCRKKPDFGYSVIPEPN